MDSSNAAQNKLFGEDVGDFCEMFKEVLIVLGYNDEDAISYVAKFMGLVEVRVLERARRRLSEEARVNFDELVSKIGRRHEKNISQGSEQFDAEGFEKQLLKINDIVAADISPEELQILYSESLNDLFREYLETVGPKMNDEQRKKIMNMIETMKF